jgi:hypothetical protein
MAKKYHPDRNPRVSAEQLTRRMAEINWAKDELERGLFDWRARVQRSHGSRQDAQGAGSQTGPRTGSQARDSNRSQGGQRPNQNRTHGQSRTGPAGGATGGNAASVPPDLVGIVVFTIASAIAILLFSTLIIALSYREEMPGGIFAGFGLIILWTLILSVLWELDFRARRQWRRRANRTSRE